MDQIPSDQAWSPQLWMVVSDIFHIRGRGTVVTGLLEGDGELRRHLDSGWDRS
jgi:translation elongation factor EF-Tu-like GTPase